MPYDYRKPGVYVEESLLLNSADTAAATSIALFAGATKTGRVTGPVRCNTWSDFVMEFDSFGTIELGTARVTPYLPYAVYSYFQNGGRPCYVQRAISTDAGEGGEASSVNITDGALSPTVAFSVDARSVGSYGNSLSVRLFNPDPQEISLFSLVVYKNNIEIERFDNLTMDGTLNGDVVSGVRAVDAVINDPYSGSAWVYISNVNVTVQPVTDAENASPLAGGEDPGIPNEGDISDAAVAAVQTIEGPVIINCVGHRVVDPEADNTDVYVYPNVVNAGDLSDRGDVFIINDSAPQRISGMSSSDYINNINTSTTLAANPGSSYVAAFTPWIIIPDPQKSGATVTIPPGGAVAGVMSRVDSTVGVFRAPAGMIASISNAVGVDTRFTDYELGQLNSSNINVIRPVQGAGICVMGARTRKVYGADRYISARRTLIYIKESLRRSTQFALFENNDNRLWTQLIMTAERLLRPLWEAGGLRGVSAAEAYYIKCDSTINTPSVISSGEVRMEIGVALEYPAEFIVIRVSQFESGGFAAEVQPAG